MCSLKVHIRAYTQKFLFSNTEILEKYFKRWMHIYKYFDAQYGLTKLIQELN
jgi:hypothetical protein